jgi:hypothetical protein
MTTSTFNNSSTGRSGTLQTYTVPTTGTYLIEAWGSEGGTGVSIGGLGARMYGEFDLTAGQTLNILVGQEGMGTIGSSGGGSGGGGTFVLEGSTLLIAAGGGGGGSYRNTQPGDPGTGGTTATDGLRGNSSSVGAGSIGGTGGNGGTAGTNAAGGGGYSGNGLTSSAVTGGSAYVNGGFGGLNGSGSYTSDGGFGGGGGGQHGGGGGGGYSGGGGGTSNYGGGGGGSYNSGTNQDNTAAVRSGHGQVVITAQNAPPTTAVTSPADNTSVPLTAGVDFTYTYTDPDSNPQSGYAFKRRVVTFDNGLLVYGAEEWWDGSAWVGAAVTVVPVPAAYSDVILADGPVGYWRLDETSGTTAADLSGNGHDATYEGGPTLGVAGAIYDGDTAVSFDGTDDGVSISNAADFQSDTVTLEAWVKTSSPGAGFRGIIVKRLAYALYLLDGELVTYDWSVSTLRSTGVNLADGVWHHVAMTAQNGVTDGSTTYIDGVAVSVLTHGVQEQSSPLMLAAGPTGQNIQGVIDEAAIYDRVLTGSEVAEHYAAGLGDVLAPITISDWPSDFDTYQYSIAVSDGTVFSDYTAWRTLNPYEWWDGSAWAPMVETWVYSSEDQFTVPEAAVSLEGDGYAWAAATRDVVNLTGPYSGFASFTVSEGVKLYDGSVWADYSIRIYNGSTWGAYRTRVYNGTEWVDH